MSTETSPTSADGLPRTAEHPGNAKAWLVRGVAALGLVTVICLVYGRALHSPFIFDDMATIEVNQSLVRLWPLVGTEEEPGPLNPPTDIPTSARPLVNLTLAVNYYFGQLDPAGYRAVNIALHALSALLLWAIVARTLRLDFFGGRFDQAAGPLAFATALVWALHPLVTETVVYVTQRTELMMAVAYLATMYASLRYWAAQGTMLRAAWLTAAFVASILGMLSKEMMASAPAIVLLYERTFVAGSFRRALRDSWPLYVGLALTWAPLVYYNAQGPTTPLAGFGLGVSASEWWLTQANVVWIYLKLTVWPWPLVIYYDIPFLQTLGEAWTGVVATSLLALATLVLVWRRTAVGFVGAWFFAILSPTLVVPLITEVAVERRMYLPLAAIVALAIAGGYALAARWVAASSGDAAAPRRGRLPLVLTSAGALALAVLYAAVSLHRLAAYEDEIVLWKEVAALQPHSAIARFNIATLLAEENRQQEAVEYFLDSLRLDPDAMQVNYNLGRALEDLGRPDEAIRYYQRAVTAPPPSVQEWPTYRSGIAAANNNLGRLLESNGKLDQAISYYRQALRSKDDFGPAHNNLAIALVKTGRLAESIPHFERAVHYRETVEGYTNLATAYAQVGRSADAVAAAQKAVELARAQGQTALADNIEAHLSVYREQSASP